MNTRKILVIEDNNVNMELVTDLLEMSGYKVVQAGNAETGINLAASERPDIILMDISLPGMDGLRATRTLKRRPDTSTIPIVALTAHAMNGDGDRVREAGCDGYITKPLDTREFVKGIEAMIDSTSTPVVSP